MSEKSNSVELKVIEIDKTKPYSKQVYNEYSPEKLETLAESIKAYGVIEPILVRPLKDDPGMFEIIAGHNRTKAAKLAELTVIPAQIKNLSDDEADIQMVESNSIRRDEMLPSEKGRAYKAYLEAHKRQGSRSDLTDLDLTSGRIGQKSSTREKLAILYGETETQIRRYIDLIKLISDLVKLVDDKKLPLNSAVNISVLNQSEQKHVLNAIKDNPKRLSIAVSTNLRKRKSQGTIPKHEIESIINAANDSRKNETKARTIKLSPDLFSEYFSDDEQDEAVIEKIKEALELLKNQ